jgi:DNA-binding beta-propeller fold protein YncE
MVLAGYCIKTDALPSELLVHGQRLYVSCFHGASLLVFDLHSREQLQRTHLDARETLVFRHDEGGIIVGQERRVMLCPPGDLVMARGKLFVGQTFGEHVVVFDAPTMWVVKRLPLKGDGHFAVSPDGSRVLYASSEEQALFVIILVRSTEDGRSVRSST